MANIYVRNISMSNAQNGARIKVFGGNPSPTSTAGGGTGYVVSNHLSVCARQVDMELTS